jgi:hypothetical protein
MKTHTPLIYTLVCLALAQAATVSGSLPSGLYQENLIPADLVTRDIQKYKSVNYAEAFLDVDRS